MCKYAYLQQVECIIVRGNVKFMLSLMCAQFDEYTYTIRINVQKSSLLGIIVGVRDYVRVF